MQLSDWLIHATEHLSAAGISADEARLEARLLAQHALGFTREQLITRSHISIDTALLEPLLARRAGRESLAYITGARAFYGLDFYVTPAVLIPRPETELLVDTVREYFAELPPEQAGTLADIGTGSGSIAVSLAKYLPQAQVFATDISTDALAVAHKNAERHGTAVTLLRGDLLEPLPEGVLFDAVVSNPPYIARAETDTLEPEVLGEPHTALFDIETDGLGFYRRLANETPPRLKQGGLLAVEVGLRQGESVAQLFTAAGFTNVTIQPDLAGIGRVVLGYMASVAENG